MVPESVCDPHTILLHGVLSNFRSRAMRQLEIIAPRHQLDVLRRSSEACGRDTQNTRFLRRTEFIEGTGGDARVTAPARGGAALAPGSRLIREWRGRTHTVEVLDRGFRCDGKQYRSLSAIARAITGARWSGPRFFGL